MGIYELTKFIETRGVLVPYDEYANQCVVIDAFQKIYKYCITKDEECNVSGKWDRYHPPAQHVPFNHHLRAVINCANQLLKYKITPIFVFDGTSIASKTKNKTNIVGTVTNDEKSDGISGDALATPHSGAIKKKFRISPQQIKECEMLIGNIGLPCIRAPYEADSQCAAMTMRTHTDKIATVMTDDTDALVFGSNSILRMLPMVIVDALRAVFSAFVGTFPDVTQQYSIHDIIDIMGWCDQKHGNSPIRKSQNFGVFVNIIRKLKDKLNIHIKYNFQTIVNFSRNDAINFAVQYVMSDILLFLKEQANAILSQIGKTPISDFTRNNFIDMCILFGTDYLPRISNMSANNTFKHFVLSNFSIATYIATLESKNIPENYISIVNDVKKYYIGASVVDPNTVDITFHKPDENKLYEQLREAGFSHAFTMNCVRNYKKNYNNLLGENTLRENTNFVLK